MSVTIQVSVGELFDKYSILLIKNKKINNIQSLEYIQKELNILKPIKDKYDNDDLLNKLKQ